MKLERLHLKNFRCFTDFKLEFGKRLTVIIAENGTGKTAILDAIAIGFGRYLTKLPGIAGRTIKEADLHILSEERRAPFTLLAWEAHTHNGRPLTWTAGRKRDAAVTTRIKQQLSEPQLNLPTRGMKEIDEYTRSILQDVEEKKPCFLPIVAYYGTNRAIREEVRRRRGFKKQFSRFEALAGALEPDASFRAAFEWFNAMEDEERRERVARRDFNFEHPELQTVRTAIKRLLPEYENPRTETRPLRFVIDQILPDNQVRTVRVSQLSDGYRVVLGLAMDLARRMVEANDHSIAQNMGVDSPLDLPALVLIDEVELHLHPSWQQRIVTDLMQTFTATQFVLTTHSPQVLSTVKRENIRIIFKGADGQPQVQIPYQEVVGLESAVALNDVMGVNPIPPIDAAQMIADYTAAIENHLHETDEARELRDKLLDIYGDGHQVLRDADRLIRFQDFKLRHGER